MAVEMLVELVEFVIGEVVVELVEFVIWGVVELYVALYGV
jgi:hypothetical protein